MCCQPSHKPSMLAYEYQSSFLKLIKRQADVRFLLNSGVLLPASRVTLNTRVRYIWKKLTFTPLFVWHPNVRTHARTEGIFQP